MTITLTPASITINVGATDVFAATITGGSTTAPPTLAFCASVNVTIAVAVPEGAAALYGFRLARLP